MNSRLNLGDTIEDAQIITNILISLPEMFQSKVTTISENKHLNIIIVE